MKITTIALDVDGVLTDGRQYMLSTGVKLCKTFHARDRQAIRRLLEAGYRIVIMSADDFDGAREWAETIIADNGNKAEFIYTRNKDLEVLDWPHTLGVADDIADAPFLEKCALGCVPNDADERLLSGNKLNNDWRFRELYSAGGRGVVCEIEEMLDIVNTEQKSRPNALYN